MADIVGAQTPSTVQQQFDAASAALVAEKWEDALTILEGLERRLSKSARSVGIVRVRKAEALLRLGRTEAAAEAIRLGLPALPADDPSLREDRFLANLTLGELDEIALDYGAALEHYRLANALSPDVKSASGAIRGLVQTGMFYDAEGALAEVDRALAATAASSSGDKPLEALLRTLRGRTLINLGRADQATTELGHAVRLLGGLTRSVNAADIAVRSDMSIALLLANKPDKAREYLAWTGAGRIGGFPLAVNMEAPPCGDGLTPDDVAVVEFSVREDGSIARATPIYSSRQGSSAIAFAQAVSQWSFNPEELKTIAPLFRLMTRVELRCTTTAKRPSVTDMLGGDVDAWLSAKGQDAVMDGKSNATLLPKLKDELARREAATGPTALALLPVLRALAVNDITPGEDRKTYLDRGLALARANTAPAPVIAWFATLRALAEDNPGKPLRALLADPQIAADPRALAAVRLRLGDHLYYKGASTRDEALAVLAPFRTGAGLDRDDVIRAAALTRIASLELASGRPEEARRVFDASGLTSDQCTLLDRAPRMKSSGASSADYPMEALNWGFEGWAVQEFDISAKGATEKVRSVVAYPPFVFSKAATDVLRGSRFDVSFRPDGALGCGGQQKPVHFRNP